MFKIVAVCDTVPERLENRPEPLRGAKPYADYAAMLRNAEVELVSLANRHPEHAPMALAALEAGKYVNVDKPCALNAREMDRLVEVCRRHPGKLFFRHNRRFEAPFVKARKIMASGVLGEINTVKLYRSVGYCRRNDWMTMTEFGGGLLMNWGPHLIDQALHLLESPVADVWASVKRVISIGDGDDHVKLLLRAENGRVADIEISGAHALPGREMEIQGSRGTLAYPENGKIHLRHVDPDLVFEPLKPHPENPPFQYGNFDETLTFVEQWIDVLPTSDVLWEHIYHAVRNDTPFPITLEEAAEVVHVTDRAFRASGFAPAKVFLDKT